MLEPSFAITPGKSPAVLRVDGVSRPLGDVAVLPARHRAAYPGTLQWSIELTGEAAHAIAGLIGIAAGHPRAHVAARLLDELRPLLLRAHGARPKFVLCTVDRVDAAQSRLRLAGTCASLM